MFQRMHSVGTNTSRPNYNGHGQSIHSISNFARGYIATCAVIERNDASTLARSYRGLRGRADIASRWTVPGGPLEAHHTGIHTSQQQQIVIHASGSCSHQYPLARFNAHESSPGFASVSNEQMESKTLDIVRAGLQLSFRMSRQIAPLGLILQ